MSRRLLRLLNRLGIRRPVERLLVKYTSYSLLSRVISDDAGVPYIPTLLLTTLGRKSGRPQEIPIFYFVDEQGRYILVGSKGGSPTHPDWYRNLRRNPIAWVRVNRREIPVRYEEVRGEERARLWEMVANRWPTYRRYEARAAPREIPLVALRPTLGG